MPFYIIYESAGGCALFPLLIAGSRLVSHVRDAEGNIYKAHQTQNVPHFSFTATTIYLSLDPPKHTKWPVQSKLPANPLVVSLNFATPKFFSLA